MRRTFSGSVGDGEAKRNSDIRTIQEMLNRVPPAGGGPAPAVAVDGLIGPKAIGAIRNFQQNQLGTIFNPDGRVDPGRRTIGRLNHIWDSAERPGGSFHLSREPIDHIRQKTNMVCWAAAGTTLCSARDRMCAPVEVIMTRADSTNPRYAYLTISHSTNGN